MKIKRKIIVVDKKLQQRIIFLFLVVGLVVSVSAYLLTEYICQGYDPEAKLKPLDFRETALQVFGISVILSVLASYVLGMWGSHKIAGPLYRIHKTLGMLSDGDFTDRIYLRKGDFLPQTVEKVNTALINLREKVDARGKTISEIDKMLLEISQGISSEEDKRKLEKARDELAALRGVFKSVESSIAPDDAKPEPEDEAKAEPLPDGEKEKEEVANENQS